MWLTHQEENFQKLAKMPWSWPSFLWKPWVCQMPMVTCVGSGKITKCNMTNPKECDVLEKVTKVEDSLGSAYVWSDCMPRCQISPLVQNGAKTEEISAGWANLG